MTDNPAPANQRPTDNNAADIDAQIAQLLAEGERALANRKRGRPRQSPASKPTSKPQPRIDRLKLLHERRVQDFASMHKGVMPGGWELEHLATNLLTVTCDYCLSVSEVLSPPAVFLVFRQVRNHATKFMRPLREGEIGYWLSCAGARLVIERGTVNVPLCQHCLTDMRE